MSDTILIALDLTHPGHHEALLTKATQLSRLDDARLAVVTVVPDFGMSIVGTYFSEDAEKEALQAAANALHHVVKTILGEEADARVKHVVRHGTAYQEILAAAKMVGASLILMGAHKPNFGDYLLGPNAARVVRHADCSVMVLREA